MDNFITYNLRPSFAIPVKNSIDDSGDDATNFGKNMVIKINEMNDWKLNEFDLSH